MLREIEKLFKESLSKTLMWLDFVARRRGLTFKTYLDKEEGGGEGG